MDKILLILFCSCVFIGSVFSAYPVVIFHGIGDSCKGSYIVRFQEKVKQRFNVYSTCIESGGGTKDFTTSILTQSKEACQNILNDKNLQNDFSIVGLSQGGLIGRYIIEKCPIKGKVRRLVTIGTPHMGVSKLPHCFSGIICYVLKKFVSLMVYSPFIQDNIGPAGYFVDHLNYERYLRNSNFLPEINNERYKNSTIIKNFLSLEKVVLIKFSKDSMIYPKESAWFEFIDQNDNVIPLKNSSFYLNDNIGLAQLIKEKKVKFVDIYGDHLQFDITDEEKYILPALK